MRLAVHGQNDFAVDETRFTLAPTPKGWSLNLDGQLRDVNIVTSAGKVHIFDQGRCHSFTITDPLAQNSRDETGGLGITAPMPGLVSQVMVSAGDVVEQNDVLMILEAMKMEHRLTAQQGGLIEEVLCTAGDQVSDGALLIKFAESMDE